MYHVLGLSGRVSARPCFLLYSYFRLLLDLDSQLYHQPFGSMDFMSLSTSLDRL